MNRIYNTHRVNDRLWRGGQPLEHEWISLRTHGIRRVIKLNEPTTGSDHIAETLGIELVRLYIPDLEAQTKLSDPGILERIDAAIDSSPGPVFVHCTEGKDRTGIALARYRVRVDGWAKHEALNEWEMHGSHGYKGLVAAWHAWDPKSRKGYSSCSSSTPASAPSSSPTGPRS